MKVRNGFVTNSSSSSFILSKDKVKQVHKLKGNLTKGDVFRLLRDTWKKWEKDNDDAMRYLYRHGYNRELWEYPDFFLDKAVGGKEMADHIRKEFGLEPISLYGYINKPGTPYGKWRCSRIVDLTDYGINLIDIQDIIAYNRDGGNYDIDDIIDWYGISLMEGINIDNYTFKKILITDDTNPELDNEKVFKHIEMGMYSYYMLIGDYKRLLEDIFKDKVIISSTDGVIPYHVCERLGEVSDLYCMHMG